MKLKQGAVELVVVVTFSPNVKRGSGQSNAGREVFRGVCKTPECARVGCVNTFPKMSVGIDTGTFCIQFFDGKEECRKPVTFDWRFTMKRTASELVAYHLQETGIFSEPKKGNSDTMVSPVNLVAPQRSQFTQAGA